MEVILRLIGELIILAAVVAFIGVLIWVGL